MGKTFKEFDGGVAFKNVNVGEATARLGVVIDRGVCDLLRADDLFCDRRLTGRVVLGHAADDARQTKAFDSDHEVSAVFDVTGFRVNSQTIGLGLQFQLKEIDIAELAKFSAKEGRLVIEGAAEIPEEDKLEKKDEHIPGTLKAEGPWRDVDLDELFEPEKGIRKALKADGIDNVGQLADWTNAGKLLTDIKGIGELKAEEIENRMVEFWADNPEANPDGGDDEPVLAGGIGTADNGAAPKRKRKAK